MPSGVPLNESTKKRIVEMSAHHLNSDIARRLGISRRTVIRVLSGKDNS